MKRKVIFLLYRVLGTLALPAILLYLLARCMGNGRYFPTLRQRFGELPASWQKTAPEAIWFHAVSVGEVLCALPLMEEIRNRSPRTPLFLSTTTLAGYDTAAKRAAHLTNGIFRTPLDFAWCVRRVLRRIRPSVVVILETEIWPNLIREAKRVGCGVTIANGRISDRAFSRYRNFSFFFSEVLRLCDRIAVQSDEMRERYIAAGADAETVVVAGNLKYDFTPAALASDSPLHAFFKDERPLWIAASTHDVEEDIVLEAQCRLTGWRLVIAPRQPDRFEAMAEKLEASRLLFTRRSGRIDPAADILLLDSIGELSGIFARADVVFMGGTIADKGGHNILEPALFGKPVVAGPHLENFRDIERHFEARNAIVRVQGDLANAVLRAAADETLGVRALAAAREQQGAAFRTADVVMALYNSRYPNERPAQPAWMFLWCLSQIWRIASARDRRRKRLRQRKLTAKVVSVGNITAGGTGKTPITIELLRAFPNGGLLTRGHGRNTKATVLYLGEPLPVELTGDEAQLYVQSVNVPMGIGADRFSAGEQLIAAAHPETLFLDDGFQHLQLARDFDLVLIDALRPFGGGHLLPLGRLREPLEGLGRADAFILTRTQECANVAAIEANLPPVPVFHAATVPRAWRNAKGETFAPTDMRGRPAVAFCGLGNPDSFWRMLKSIGIETLAEYHYGDHHRYAPLELRKLAQHARDIGANVLLTTAKDAVNLCENDLPIYWLEIAMEIDQRERIIRLLTESLSARQPRGMNVVEP